MMQLSKLITNVLVFNSLQKWEQIGILYIIDKFYLFLYMYCFLNNKRVHIYFLGHVKLAVNDIKIKKETEKVSCSTY